MAQFLPLGESTFVLHSQRIVKLKLFNACFFLKPLNPCLMPKSFTVDPLHLTRTTTGLS